MAGDWIKWEKGLARKREVMSVAHKLSVDRRVIAAACMEVWEWADGETDDGHVEGVPMGVIDDVAGLTGFADALVGVGWLRVTEGGLSFPKFDRHNGETAKRRLSNSRRQAKSRARSRDPSVTSVTEKRDAGATQERREEGEKRKPASQTAQPDISLGCVPEGARGTPNGQTGQNGINPASRAGWLAQIRAAETVVDALEAAGVDEPTRSHVATLSGLTVEQVGSEAEKIEMSEGVKDRVGLLIYRLGIRNGVRFGQSVGITPEVVEMSKRIEELRRAAMRRKGT